MVEEYYVMPDGKIFCYDCWRDGKMEASAFEQKQRMQFRRVEMEQALFTEEQKAAKRKLEELDNAIDIEKRRCLRDWQDYEEEFDAPKGPVIMRTWNCSKKDEELYTIKFMKPSLRLAGQNRFGVQVSLITYQLNSSPLQNLITTRP